MRTNIRSYAVQAMLLLWVSLPCMVIAQHSFFRANGKKINTASFDKKVRHIMQEAGIPAASVAIISGNQVVYANNYGIKQLSASNAVDNNTLFEACSLSKSFLVFVVYKLFDAGKLDLDKPLYEYLEYDPLKYDPRYKAITARMVLSHTSGLENWRWHNNADTLEILNNPGERFIYSGEGYQYLAKVVELILHKNYETYIKEMVITPLHLENTYPVFTYKDGQYYPLNYTIGHDSFGKEIKKFIHEFSIPAGGMNLTAQDYARLIIAIFNKENISANSIKTLCTPVIQLGIIDYPDRKTASLYYGPGFELLFNNKDTIIMHGGSNSGFKALICYSIVKKCGLVLLTNSDLGKTIAKRLCTKSIGLNIGPYYDVYNMDAYPSITLQVLKAYKTRDTTAMLSQFAAWEKKHNRQPDVTTLSELGKLFMNEQPAIAQRFLEENVRLHERSAYAWYMLGQINMTRKDYNAAYGNLLKAKELRYSLNTIDPDIRKCREMLEANPNTGHKVSINNK